MNSLDHKVWLITGATSGLGRSLARFAATTGDRVLATARRESDLQILKDQYPDHIATALLDVTDVDSVDSALETGLNRFGRIDVVVNNAGYGVLGALEELSDKEVRQVLETNLHGVLNVTRTVLPVMRRQRSGHLIQMSSISGAQPWTGFSIYVGSKHAVEGFSSSLATEIAPLGIHVTIVEPGPFRTDFFGRSMHRAKRLPAYEKTVGATSAFLDTFEQPGDPDRAAAAIHRITQVDKPPLRLALGHYALEAFREEYQSRLAELSEWAWLTETADFPTDTGTEAESVSS